MAFLYASCIISNAILSSTMGEVIDDDFAVSGNITASLRQVGGIQFSVCWGIILLATLIPDGASSFSIHTLSTYQFG